jgi:predicted lipid-binding transport protein (Tim44 family)
MKSFATTLAASLAWLAPAPAQAAGLLQSLGGGEEFTGPTLIDIVIIGAVVFVVLRMISGHRGGGAQHGPDTRDQAPDEDEIGARRRARAQSAWQHLGAGEESRSSENRAAGASGGFDREEFLRGAKLVYSRLQESWDQGDLEDIRDFTTDKAFQAIQERARESASTEPPTNILMVEAEVTNVDREDHPTRVTVSFEALIRDDPSQTSPRKVNEVWEFVRKPGNGDSTWKLDAVTRPRS